MSSLNKLFFSAFFLVYSLWGSLVVAQVVNVNTATKSELQTIKGIGEKTAQRIVEERERGGTFESVEDFSIRVKGVGQKRTAKLLESGLSFDNEETSTRLKSSQKSDAQHSVVAKEIATIKKRFKYTAPTNTSEPYLIKVN